MNIISKTIRDFWGTIDTLEDRSLPYGAASSALNWICLDDKIELRRGSKILGNEITGVGKITSLFRTTMSNGTQVLFRTRLKKLEYYKTSTETWTEIGSDVLGTDADGKDISFAEYHSLAGDQLFVNSPYGPYLKIMLANPASYSTMYDSTKNYKGYILIKQNRTFLWGRIKDKTGLYISWIDNQNFTTVSAENVGTGDNSEKTFNDTLAFKAGGAKRTCFGIEATDGTETFADNYDGTLTGDAGGTGTINYTSGAISLTFNTAPAGSQAITCDYQWEDSTNEGICDFDYSSPRVAGEGDIIRQDDGGILQNIMSYGDTEYCLHKNKTWVLALTSDDTNATNLVYREKVGIPNWKACVATGDGIYYVDVSDDKDYQIKLLTLSATSEKVIPRSISKQILYKKKRVGTDLSDYRFDKAIGFEWGDYILFACRTSDFTENNRVILYHKIQKSIDVLEYYVSDFTEYDGTLITADSMGKNVFTLFSGYDDDDSSIVNSREENFTDLDWNGLQKVKKIIIQGAIGPDQTIRVYASIDSGAYVTIGDIKGDGDYVDKSQSISVGALTVGSKETGGGGEEIEAYNYVREINFDQDKFNKVKLKFEAKKLGYASITSYQFFDIRHKNKKIPSKYRN